MNFQKIISPILLFGALLLLLAAACKQEPPPPTAVSQCNPIPVPPPALPAIVESITYQGPEIYGPVHSLHVEGDKMYLGMGNNFAIMDVSNAAEPQLLGTIPLHRSAFSGIDIYAVRDDLVYLEVGIAGTADGAAYIIDVTNPAEPVMIDCDPAIPQPRWNTFNGRYEIYFGSSGVTINEQTTDGSMGQEIAAFALYSPPRIEWNQPPGQRIPLPSITRSKAMHTSSFTFDERYLYMLSLEYLPGQICCGRLSILDLENPADPDHLSTTVLPSDTTPHSVEAVGDFLLVGTHHSSGSVLTIVFDITDRRRPVELASIPTASLFFQVNDRYAYFPDWSRSEIAIWDLQEEDGPQLIGKIAVPDTFEAFSRPLENNLAFVDDYIYLANGRALEILDNHDPANPYFVDRIEYPLLLYTNQVAIYNNQLAASIIRRGGTEIQILEIEPGGQIGEWQLLSAANGLERVDELSIYEGYLYTLGYLHTLNVALEEEDETTTLNVFDLTKDVEMSSTAALSLNDFAGSRMAATSSHLYLSEIGNFTRIAVVDISEPLNPTLAGEIEVASGPIDLAVWQDNLYLFSPVPSGSLSRYDISDPIQPQFSGRYEFEFLRLMTTGDGFLFAINYVGNAVQVIDLRPSEGPVFVGEFDIAQGTIWDMAYENGVLYLALGERGLAAVKLNIQ